MFSGPSFDETLRSELLNLLESFRPIPRGVYTQTRGPRFETPAEIRMLALAGDLVGMTCAHEASLAKELSLPYAVICMVDNMANGLAEANITYEEFKIGVQKNLVVMEKILESVLKHFSTQARPVNINGGSSGINNLIQAESIIHSKYIVPMDDKESVLENHSLIIGNDGEIIDLLPSNLVNEKYSSFNIESFPDSVLMPGLINGHSHSGMTLMRGFADDYCLHDWLTQHIWPTEAKFVGEEFVAVSSELAIAELIQGGCTTINDMYWFPNITAKLVDKVGYRALIGLPVLDFPGAWASNIDEYFNKGESVRSSYINHPRIEFSVAPHAPYTVCDENLTRVLDVSKKTSNKIHTHLHETESEVLHSIAGDGPSKHRSEHKLSPIENLNRLGLLNSSLIAVHMTQLTDSDIKLLSNKNVNIVHCPSSNLKLASGFCRVGSLLESGCHVGIGTDSSASNNSLDMWSELKTAAILAKAVSKDSTVVPAYQALRMATIDGAKVLGLESKIGSLTKGKHADFIAVNLNTLDMLPLYDVISHLVYSASKDRVSDVWIKGQRLLQNKKLLTINELKLKETILQWQEKLLIFKKQYLAEAAKAKTGETPPVIEAPVDTEMNGDHHHHHGQHREHPPSTSANGQ